ncbi:hypothetical protein GCM10027346_20610 [Hymenobacter seoulensis]
MSNKQIPVPEVTFYNHVEGIIDGLKEDIKVAAFYVEHRSTQPDDRNKIFLYEEFQDTIKQRIAKSGTTSEVDEVIVSGSGDKMTLHELWGIAKRLDHKILREKRNEDFVYLSSFTHLVTLLDAALIDIVKSLMELIPELLWSDAKSISYSNLFKANSLDELKAHIIDKEITSFGFKSLKEQIDYIHKFSKLTLIKNNEMLNNLIEIRETRNIIIHNKGVVNYIYNSNVHNSQYKIGDYRTVDAPYFAASSNTLIDFINYFTSKLLYKYAPNYRINEQWKKEGKELTVGRDIRIDRDGL